MSFRLPYEFFLHNVKIVSLSNSLLLVIDFFSFNPDINVSKICILYVFVNCLKNSTPLTEFPIESNLGEYTHTPPMLGITANIAPLTPDLAGRPISNDHLPL